MGKRKDTGRNGQGKRTEPETYTIPASAADLTKPEIYVLRLLMEGHPPPPAVCGRTLGRLGARGLIEAAGRELADGWKLTDAGVLALRRPGTFRKYPRTDAEREERVEEERKAAWQRGATGREAERRSVWRADHRRTEWRAAPLLWLGLGAAIASAVMWWLS